MPSSTKLASCPTFIRAPFICPSVAATCWAERSSSSASSSSLRSAEANTDRARCTAEVRVFAVAIEDGEDLDRPSVAGHPVRRHRVELGRLPGVDQDLAVARFTPTELMKKIRPISLAPDKPNAGDPVVVVGYPLGVSAMLAKSPSNVFSRLASKKDAIEIASDLAQHDLIRPSSTCGHVSDIVGEKLIYDAPTAQGGSGGPVFNSNGEAIAVNAAYIDGFTGGTIGITTESLKPLLQNAMQKTGN